MDHPRVAGHPDRHARCTEARRVGLALVAERVELGRDDERRREPAEARRPEGTGVGVEGIRRRPRVVIPEPPHRRRGQEVALGVIPVRARLAGRVRGRVDEQLVNE